MATNLAAGVWQVDLGGVNAALVADDDGLTLVDAGLPWHADAVAAACRVAGDGPAAVERVLLTHYDVDHVGALGRIDGLDAPVYAGEPDASYVAGRGRPPIRSRKGLFQRAFGVGLRRPSGPVHAVDDGDTIGGFTAYHTAGHTPGHVAYVNAERSVALLGDLVRTANGRFEPAPRLLSDDMADVRRSIRSFADRATGFDVAIVGHGEPVVSDAAARFGNLAER